MHGLRQTLDFATECSQQAKLFSPQQLKALGSQPGRLRGGPGFHEGFTRVPPGFHEGFTRVPPGFHEGSTRFCEGFGVVRALKNAPHAVRGIT